MVGTLVGTGSLDHRSIRSISARRVWDLDDLGGCLGLQAEGEATVPEHPAQIPQQIPVFRADDEA